MRHVPKLQSMWHECAKLDIPYRRLTECKLCRNRLPGPQERQLKLDPYLLQCAPQFFSEPGLKKEPCLGKTIFSGAATNKNGKKGATEQLRLHSANWPRKKRSNSGPASGVQKASVVYAALWHRGISKKVGVTRTRVLGWNWDPSQK